MQKITLIGTTHHELGLCNEDALVGILEYIRPDVIFEEIRQSDFDVYYSNKLNLKLESRAIRRYVEVFKVQQVPVDDFIISENVPKDIERLFDYVESHSRTYVEANILIDQKTYTQGFNYLSSIEFAEQNQAVEALSEKVVAESGRDDLMAILALWKSKLSARRASMVENIYAFSCAEKYQEAVFLVGAAHVPAILEEVRKRATTEASLIDWNVWNR